MKIVSYGKIKPVVVQCHKCEATLEYVNRDLKIKQNRWYFNCPICGHPIIVNNSVNDKK